MRCSPPWRGRRRCWWRPRGGDPTWTWHSRLRPLGARVVAVADAPILPFRVAAFDLVVSRHPVIVLWTEEVARVLRPGGTYLSQQIGPGANRGYRQLHDGPPAGQPEPECGSGTRRGGGGGTRGGQPAQVPLRVEFSDIGAVVHFLRKVRWTVPDFTPEAYAGTLRRMHERIEREGPFVSTARRLLVKRRAAPGLRRHRAHGLGGHRPVGHRQ